MWYLIIPDDIALIDEFTGEPLKKRNLKTGEELSENWVLSFREWLIRSELRDPQFGADADAIDAREGIKDAWKRMDEKYKDVPAGTPRLLELENDGAQLLKKVVEKPSRGTNPQTGMIAGGYVPELAGQCRAFLRRVRDMKEKVAEAYKVAGLEPPASNGVGEKAADMTASP